MSEDFHQFQNREKMSKNKNIWRKDVQTYGQLFPGKSCPGKCCLGAFIRACLAHKVLLKLLHIIYEIKTVPQLATWLRHRAWPLRSPALLAHRLSIRTNNSRHVKAPARVWQPLESLIFFFFFTWRTKLIQSNILYMKITNPTTHIRGTL